ncbi:hypothetical protein P3S68_012023 [Capsicum galapagoense]
MNRTRILSQSPSHIQQSKTVKKKRYIPQSAERTLDAAPDILDDFYLNLLD